MICIHKKVQQKMFKRASFKRNILSLNGVWYFHRSKLMNRVVLCWNAIDKAFTYITLMNKRKILYLIIPWNKFQGVVFYDSDDSRFWIAIQRLMIKVKLMIWEEQTNRDCNVHTKICMNAMNGGSILKQKISTGCSKCHCFKFQKVRQI